MQELLDDIIHYVRGVWLQRRYILIASWLVCPLGWALVTALPNQYTSEARVYADTRSILKPLLRGLAIQTDPTQELQLMVKTLLSRPNLEIIARDTDADVRAKNSQEYEEIINDLENNIEIKGTGRDKLYTLSYQGVDPLYAKDVVQATLNVFVENTLSEQRIETDQANEILTEQIGDYEVRLAESERKLAEFKREFRGFLPGSGSDYYAQLEQNKQYLEDAQLALSEGESRYESTKAQLRKEESTATEQLSRMRTEYDERIELLQQRLDELLFRFTEKHPDVIETRRQLKELNGLKGKALASYSISDALANNVLYQDLKLTVSQLENEVASLKVRVRKYDSKITDLQDRLNRVPDVEAKLTALNRDYDITKDKYEQLLSRKESALISQSVGDSTDDIKFRIIDAPRVPTTPSGPMRPILLAGILIIGLGSGIGISFIISQVAPVVSSVKQLRQLSDFEVFGIVSATEDSGLLAWDKRKTRIFIFLNFMLILMFVAFFAVNTMPTLQDSILNRASGLIEGLNGLMQRLNIL